MDWNIDKLFEQLQSVVTTYGLQVLAAIGILIAGRIAAGIVRAVAKGTAKKAKVEPTIASFIVNLSYVAVMAFVVIAALGRLGVQTASFVAVLGAAGLAVGLAFQGALSNFAAGFLIIIFRPFKVGDYIEAGGASGVVSEIEIFTTTITTVDNRVVVVPNSKMTGDNITNYTANETRRVDLTVGIGYGDDIDKAKTVLADVVSSFEGVLTDPPVQIAVSEMADSSVNFVVRPWVKTADYWTAYFGLTEAIKKRLDKEGINIPFPQRDVHLYREEA